MSDPRPIGVFDSGIGGLTVVKALCDLLPSEKIFYLGDTARVPYGNKSRGDRDALSVEMVEDVDPKKTPRSSSSRATALRPSR